jgi:hypothetical protein
VRVTTTEATTIVRLPPCQRVLFDGVGEVLWSPDVADGAEAEVVRSEKEVVTEMTVSTFEGVQGVFVREWGEEGEGQGEFSEPEGVAVYGEEVFVSDCSNDRVQVFGLGRSLSAAVG